MAPSTAEAPQQGDSEYCNGSARTIQESNVLHRNLRVPPMHTISANGIYLKLSNGQCVIDGTGGAAVACIGHCDKRVISAITEQMKHDFLYSYRSIYNLPCGGLGT